MDRAEALTEGYVLLAENALVAILGTMPVSTVPVVAADGISCSGWTIGLFSIPRRRT
jgi:hypothetical protein